MRGAWTKASQCITTNCVEAKIDDTIVLVRRGPHGGTVVFTTEEWDAFIIAAKRGEFDVEALRGSTEFR